MGGSMWDRMKNFDKNNDGKITEEEFDGPERFFERADADGDGVVTKAEVEEMQRSMGGRGGSRGGSGRGSGRSGGGSSRRGSTNSDWVFKKMDRNENGKFDAEDLKLITKIADKNGDGVVSEKEFNEYIKGKPMPRGTAPETGKRAPDFKLKGLTGKKEIALDQLLDAKKPVVLVFGSLT